jgi:hypothetical protein
MLERLGNLIGWIGNGLALLIGIAAVATIIAAPSDPKTLSFAGFWLVVALVIFLLGRGCRYVLRGPSA